MKLLALDTAVAACSVAVHDSARDVTLARALTRMERGHAEAIAPMVRAAMADAGLAFTAIDRIVVTIGPGTFTGVRIGLAMARGLGLALDRPVTGIDTLSAIAANEAENGKPILVAADARKGEVYAAFFNAGREMVLAPTVLDIDGCLRHLPDGPVAVVGTGADAVISASGRTDLVRSRAGDLPVAANFVRLGAALAAPDRFPSPLYLRAPDAKPLAQRKPPVAIREVGADEASLLEVLHGECFETGWKASEISRLMAMPGASVSFAMDAGEPAGFLFTRGAADEAEIITIGTRPAARRRGIARALIEDRSLRLRLEGIATLFIEVAASNAAARALYASCGFAEAGIRRGYYQLAGGQHEDAIVMRKVLTQ